MNAVFQRILICLAALCLLVSGAFAQAISTAQINGNVQDASGLAVPGAQVKATQNETGLVRASTAAGDGSFVLTNLPVGPYTLEVTRDGFSKYIQSGIVLQVGSNPNIDVALRVGSVTEQVRVEANANLVETRSTGVGQVIDNQRVLELPLNGRQATELIFQSGIATPVNGAGLNSGVRNYPTVNISVAGGLSNGLAYALDGASHNDPYNNLNLPMPFPDALQEFKVETSALPAQYGHHSAAAGTPSVDGDRDQLVQVIQNLVDNAVKFTPPGGKVQVGLQLAATLEAARAPSRSGVGLSLLSPDTSDGQAYVVVRVSDAGPGIARQHLPRLSERFYRVEGQRSGGTGLGLAIVKHVVNRHRGGFAVESAEGEGSTFSVYFPVATS